MRARGLSGLGIELFRPARDPALQLISFARQKVVGKAMASIGGQCSGLSLVAALVGYRWRVLPLQCY